MRKLYLAAVLLLAGLGTAVKAADFDGDSRDDPAVFRAATSLWAVPGITRFYFGSGGDYTIAGDYNGDGIAEPAVWRPGTGLWSVRDVTRLYVGSMGDVPVSGGGGGRVYDYIVKAGAAADLVRALESNVYTSVFIPAGDYYVNGTIHLDQVRRVQAEDPGFTTIHFGADSLLSVESAYCAIDGLTVDYGGSAAQNKGNFYIANVAYVSVSNCASLNSADDGFEYTVNCYGVSFFNCRALNATYAGFRSAFGAARTSRLSHCLTDGGQDGFVSCRNLSSCVAYGAFQYGFSGCWNLSACSTDAYNRSQAGFYFCENLSGCNAYDAASTAATAGFDGCSQLSGCRADGAGHATYGFAVCWYLSSCYSYGVTTTNFAACHNVDSDSCNN